MIYFDQQPDIRHIEGKNFVGMRTITSFSNNKTRQLWQSFMPRRKEIEKPIEGVYYSVERYPLGFFASFNPEIEFEKWAAVETVDLDVVPPEGMEQLMVPPGLYTVFIYKGSASEAVKAFQYIFQQWLPQSVYELDDRPHFEVMDKKYKGEDPDSQEEFWIPVRAKV